MSLKQECIDMFKLIFEGMPNYEDYDMEENTGVFLCPHNDYKDEEGVSFDCYECQFREACNKEFVRVDLSVFVPWWAGDEDQGSIYINFSQKPVKTQYRNTIHYINNRKQLFNLMYELKQRVDDVRNSYAEYAEKIIELRRYGQEFLLQVQNDYPVFKEIKCTLPIVFSDFAKDAKGNYKYETSGKFIVQGAQLIICVYDCWRELDSLKTTVRHEILHYLLFRIGVNNADTGGIFHYFCNKYDAHAYKEMSDKGKSIYDSLLKETEISVSMMLENIKRDIVLGYTEESA